MVRMCSGNLPDLMTMNPVVKIHEHFVPACLEQQKIFKIKIWLHCTCREVAANFMKLLVSRRVVRRAINVSIAYLAKLFHAFRQSTNFTRF